MDPLTPTTSTLSPAISHIAETAKSLAGILQDRSPQPVSAHETDDLGALNKRQQQETVRWVLATPHRLRNRLDTGNVEEAKNDWAEADGLLQHWEGVAGVPELKDTCLKILNQESQAKPS